MDSTNLQQQHPLFERFYQSWKMLADVYEGTGGFMDGSYLVPHPRELTYQITTDQSTGVTTIDYTKVTGQTEKFRRRKALARYENFASIIVDTLLDYMYAKQPARTIKGETADTVHPLRDWWENVDGEETHISDWMKRAHILAFVFGHNFLVMDRPFSETVPQTRAEQLSPFLRFYTPLDCLDWLTKGTRVAAAKFVEAIGRTTLDEAVQSAVLGVGTIPAGSGAGDGARKTMNFRLWDETEWRLFDQAGGLLKRGDHKMGEAPVVVLKARPRATVPVVGRSGLGDPLLYVDHYNLLSEKREIERSQTFSQLNIPLKDDQTPDDAQALLGNIASTQNVIFSRLPAQFLAPENTPLQHYSDELQSLERKIFRLVGLPWDADLRGAESAESRRIKALDLNRLLAGMADEAERVEYELARLWFIAMNGPEKGEQLYDDAELSIKYPDEFQTQEVLDVLVELRGKLAAGMGKTFNEISRKRALPVLAPDLTDEQLKEVEGEIEATPVESVTAAQQYRELLLKAAGGGGAAKPAEAGGSAEQRGGTPQQTTEARRAQQQQEESARMAKV